MPNKIKYGLRNVHYAVATIAEDGTATYATPKRWPGAVNLSLSATGGSTTFYADDIAYQEFSTNAGYDGDYESALVPEDFSKEVLGNVEDSEGALVEDADAATVHFALLFEFQGDEKATRHVLYNCTAQRPDVSGATKEESTEAQTESITLKARTVYNADLEKNVVKAKAQAGATAYANWYTAVHVSTAVAGA